VKALCRLFSQMLKLISRTEFAQMVRHTRPEGLCETPGIPWREILNTLLALAIESTSICSYKHTPRRSGVCDNC
jgi:hypothetical protein